MKRLILTLTALTAFVGGAFAAPYVITSLPALITKSGDYILDPNAAATPVTSGYPISIFIGNVNLDLNGATINTGAGMIIGNAWYGGAPVDHVTVKNGTFNCIAQGNNSGANPTAGVWIQGASYVSLLNLDFDGSFNYSVDAGDHDSIKNCNFESPLYAYFSTNGDYENLVVAKQPNVWCLFGEFSLVSSPGGNNFKNIRVLSSNVQLSATDTYQHFFFQPSTQILGGQNLQPGN